MLVALDPQLYAESQILCVATMPKVRERTCRQGVVTRTSANGEGKAVRHGAVMGFLLTREVVDMRHE